MTPASTAGEPRSLPLEILEVILRVRQVRWSSQSRLYTRTLIACTLTSRQMYSIAAPLLYAGPTVHYGTFPMLIRTLNERADLARCVCELDIDPYLLKDATIPPLDLPILPNCLRLIVRRPEVGFSDGTVPACVMWQQVCEWASSCPLLQSIRVAGLYLETDNSNGVDLTRAPPNLHTLELAEPARSYDSESAKWLWSNCPRSLQQLVVGPSLEGPYFSDFFAGVNTFGPTFTVVELYCILANGPWLSLPRFFPNVEELVCTPPPDQPWKAEFAKLERLHVLLEYNHLYAQELALKNLQTALVKRKLLKLQHLSIYPNEQPLYMGQRLPNDDAVLQAIQLIESTCQEMDISVSVAELDHHSADRWWEKHGD